MNLSKSNLLKFYVIIAFVSLTVSCTKEQISYIPSVPVHVELDVVTDLAYLSVGGVVTIKPNPDTSNIEYSVLDYHNKKFPTALVPWQTYNNGILLYNPEPGIYLAFDMTCPYNALTDDCSINITSIPFMPACPCCKSVFNLVFEGIPTDTSKAKKGLVQYNVTLVNSGTRLIISK